MLNKYLFKQALFSDARSLARRFREKRMRYFEQEFFRAAFGDALNDDPSRTIRILDIGGTYDFWNALAFRYLNRCEITLFNLEKRGNGESMPNVRFMAGNATDLSAFGNGTFDLVFSNSCIEHIGRFPEWRKMADGMRRVGSHYFLQTPNRYFPLEPHFMFPFFQFLPLPVRAWLFQHFDLGYFRKNADRTACLREADSIHLLSLRDLKRLFPDGQVKRERLLGLTKSFMIHSPLPDCQQKHKEQNHVPS